MMLKPQSGQITRSEGLRFNAYTNEDSSWIRGVLYLPEDNLLEIRMEGDDFDEVSYFYQGISLRQYERFVSAQSLGSYYVQNIKIGNYDVRQLKDYSEESSQALKGALSEATKGFTEVVIENDTGLVKRNKELFECINRRTSDRSIVHVKDNDQLMQYSMAFREALFAKALELIIEKHGSNKEWVQECYELANSCSTRLRSHLVAQNI